LKVLFDTNVVVAALVQDHKAHAKALPHLNRALGVPGSGCLSAHGLAEAYSVLTGLPIRPRITPADARQALAVLEQQLDLIPLDRQDYLDVLERVAGLGLPGGAIYDALHAQAAIKVGVRSILTLNPKHFTRLGEDIAPLVQSP
jgi:predicted nucleic acid-binding protein